VYAFSGATISNCVLRNNISSNNGGACYVAGEGLVTDCDIYGNQAGVLGGGIVLYRGGSLSTTQLRNSRIYNNTVSGDGGGVFIEQGTIKDCIISNNVSIAGGGVCVISQGETLVENCVLTRNRTRNNGGGIYFVSGGTPGYIRNCLISGNWSTNGLSGGIAINATSARIENCTIVRNRSKSVGGGLFNNNTATVVKNTILWHNHHDAYETYANIYNDPAGSISNSCSPDLTAGVDNNITNDPDFIDSGSGLGLTAVLGDYRIASDNSPVIGAGVNSAWMNSAVDLDGNPRIDYGTVDIGAYERHLIMGTIVVVK
jgi:hypothetical protein